MIQEEREQVHFYDLFDSMHGDWKNKTEKVIIDYKIVELCWQNNGHPCPCPRATC